MCLGFYFYFIFILKSVFRSSFFNVSLSLSLSINTAYKIYLVQKNSSAEFYDT